MTATEAPNADIIEVAPRPKMSDRKNAERSLLINQILATLMMDDDQREWLASNTKLVIRLTATPDLKYLARVLELSQIAVSGGSVKRVERDRKFVIDEVSGFQRYRFNTVYANRQFLNHKYDMTDLEFTVSMFNLNYESGDFIPTLDEHLQADTAYMNMGLAFNTGTLTFYGQSDICRIVERYPSKVHVVIDLMERGFDSPQKIHDALMEMGDMPKSLSNGAL